MRETFTVFDAADFIKTGEDARLYLEACIEDGDGRLIMSALGSIAKARRVNISQLAREVGMSRSALYKALAGEAAPGFSTVQRIARSLGFDLAVRLRSEKPASAGEPTSA